MNDIKVAAKNAKDREEKEKNPWLIGTQWYSSINELLVVISPEGKEKMDIQIFLFPYIQKVFSEYLEIISSLVTK